MTVAESPSEIPARGWREVVRRSAAALAEQDIAMIAGGIAFYAVWAFFPTLVVLVVLGASLAGSDDVMQVLSWVRSDLSENFTTTVVGQLDAIASSSRRVSVPTVVIALAFALWSAMRASRSLMAALNLINGEREERSFWHRHALALGLATLGEAFLLGALMLIVGLSPESPRAGDGVALALLSPLRWPVLIVTMMAVLCVVYRYGPDREVAKWRWVTWGASASAAIWVAGSYLLYFFAAHGSRVNPLLGSLGSVTLFLFWSYLTVFTILLGAQVNAELERQTAADTRAQPQRPS